MNRELIEKYAAGADVPARSIVGLAPADLQFYEDAMVEVGFLHQKTDVSQLIAK